MKMMIWTIGKTSEKYLNEGIDKYLNKLKHYLKFEYEEFKDVKPGQTAAETSKKEAQLILSKLKTEDQLILLDEKGESYNSTNFSKYLEKLTLHSGNNYVFLIGGAYGHHELLRKRAIHLISLSKMTFTHQMVRLFLVEQFYRAFTIIKNEKYHNQ
ncbi:MAG: 23S rRNA (pseudouridine(1915)-N(3))-methyltransferase RlmH [Saprospiraceae bacterium]|jgi:23S rRNA (pseudouridine1915-N3)-methyltransferase|nr:23S rRNA (pseudouridine(1915)-N(3))-methyltransferase RlmH [Saprospiraceae bacterium]MBL0027485.1 23S rRNA (pseudouridine(1915)-N(3))-methyltransferase RlmH [Saprospiraceae bacterium]